MAGYFVTDQFKILFYEETSEITDAYYSADMYELPQNHDQCFPNFYRMQDNQDSAALSGRPAGYEHLFLQQ